MSNNIYPEMSKLMAEQRHGEMMRAAENARLLNSVRQERQMTPSPRRSGRSRVRRLVLATALTLIVLMAAATITLASGVGL